MVNPFDLRGPEFLLFYGLLGLAVTTIVFMMRVAREGGEPPRPLSDYLEIAFLRGGAGEAIRVAILTLIDRDLLTLSGDTVQAEQADAPRRVTRPTERAILTAAVGGTKASALVADQAIAGAATAECEPGLVRRGLLPTVDQKASRRWLWMLAGGALAIVAAVKIGVAISRGRANVGFLVALALLFVGLTFVVTHPRRTVAGDSLLRDLRTLFGGLKERAASFQPRQGGGDFALLAAVFGVGAALPIYPDARKLFPQPSSSDGGASDGGSSSSCGSSSCGSSCGGGGGGCGGCGSS